MTDNLKPDIDILDGAVHIPDAETIEMVYRLLDEEGIYIGASSALNVVAAVKVAEKLPEGTLWRKKYKWWIDGLKSWLLFMTGSTVATILCDGAYRYVRTLPRLTSF